MNIQQNFTRTWRSKTFEEIVGQELSVRLLKNSLAKNRLFPVYLFSGLRGSGKTSIGRIFAAAVNCEKRCNNEYCSSVGVIPCLECTSCLSVRAGSHPDFIEIDAASHNGVDNVRQIIESSAFLPVMSAKKIYLIDEAHMLSKAAFNAFLKILEEPPATVIFLLATTEAYKIPDTVRSRSLHLFFDPVPRKELVAHLQRVCEVENINFQHEALVTIAQQSEGSVRDALNSMERIVLAEGGVTTEGTHRTLGLMSDALIIQLFHYIAQGSVRAVFEYCHAERFDRYNPLHIWEKMVFVMRALLHETVEVDYKLDVSSLKPHYSIPLVLEFFDLLYRSETHITKTTAQYPFLESLFCKMTQRFVVTAAGETNKVQAMSTNHVAEKKAEKKVAVSEKAQNSVAETVQASAAEPLQKNIAQEHVGDSRWQQFIKSLEELQHPIAASIFKQGVFKVQEERAIRVQFAKKFEFYREWMFAHEHIWKAPLEQAFGLGALFMPEFNAEQSESVKGISKPTGANHVPFQGPALVREGAMTVQQNSHVSRTMQKQGGATPHDMDDSEKWPIANKITHMFPGTITAHKE